MSAQRYDVVVLGAGAAGLFAAAQAQQRGRRVLLLEHNAAPGRKILISGGGRCNFTNTGTTAENYLSANPHFARSALAAYTPADFIALVASHGIAFHEKTLGQLFCNDSAQRILSMLLAQGRGVDLRTGVAVTAVHPIAVPATTAQRSARFKIETSAGSFTADSVIVATGGLSIPKLGATGIGYDIARRFDHAIVDPRAALVPLVFSVADRDRWCDLTGLSAETLARAAPASLSTGSAGATPSSRTRSSQRARKPPIAFREKLLITHRGLSGPAVLQISSYWRPGQPLAFDLAPYAEVFTPFLASPAARTDAALLDRLVQHLPVRFAKRWLSAQPAIDFTNAGLARLESALHDWRVTPAGTEGFAKAEVTAGGVDTAELDARTLESKRTPGLYFIGEVVDVTGWLGGYNFQWAWASGHAAGRVA